MLINYSKACEFIPLGVGNVKCRTAHVKTSESAVLATYVNTYTFSGCKLLSVSHTEQLTGTCS